jgi:hypothetical protein
MRVAPSAGAVMAGAAGTAVSTVNVVGSRCVGEVAGVVDLDSADRVRPVGQVGDEHDHAPPLTMAIHRTSSPSTTMTVASVSPAPAIVGWLLLVADPSAGVMMAGGAGAAVSTVKPTAGAGG